ncbi:LOW QUALITY PROTEIN: dehydrogenase/reductase SDR family member 4-like 2 [Macaca nemestrina]|uniref:LOW QUALITY PROTEIN: dehydrogenase/reductase SDR family member 4-like 2 n=1 Tax=Macaca nemestrina TaxID=9545 RepID=UPI0039B96818
MHKAGLLGHCVRAWKSVRMASSRMTRRDLLTNKVAPGNGLHRRAVKLHGGIDILVSNAAVSPVFGSLMDITKEVWDKTLDINVKAPALMAKAVVPEMEKRGGGSVVIVASIAAFSPSPGLSPYSVSKTALLGLTKTLAIELAPRNIRVNCLHLDLSRPASAGCSARTRKKRKE